MIAQWFRSPLTRLACLLPVLTWLILSLVLIPTYHEAVSDIEGEVRNAIDEEILGLNQVYQTQGLPGLANAVDARTNDGVDRAALYLLTSSDGRRLAGAAMTWPEAVPLQDRQWFSVPEISGGTLEGTLARPFDAGQLSGYRNQWITGSVGTGSLPAATCQHPEQSPRHT